MALDIVLIGSPPLDLLLLDAKPFIDLQRRVGAEDTAAVTDQHVGGAVGVDRGEEHEQEGGQVLAWRRGTGDDGARGVIQNGDDVERLARIDGELVVLQVADVHRPDGVRPVGCERHGPLFAWDGGGGRGVQPVHPAIERHDPPARPFADWS
jgi:hypothetical protein